MFSGDYKLMTWQQGAAAAAPYLLTGFAIIYLFSFVLGIYGRVRGPKQSDRYSAYSRYAGYNGRGRYANTPFVY